MNISRRSAMKLALSVGGVAAFFGAKEYVKHTKKGFLINKGDLNNYISKGNFTVSGDVSNAPTQSGLLKVDVFGEHDEYIIQQYFDLDDPRMLLIRRKDNESEWSQWGPIVSHNERPLITKKIVCLGDSITGSFDWPKKLQKIVGGNVFNLGISGTTAAKIPGDFGMLSLCKIAEAIKTDNWNELKEAADRILKSELKQDYTKIITTLSEMDWMSVDFLIISYGTNDYGKSVSLGTDNDLSQDTFKGALNYSFEKIITKNPGLQIITSSPLWRMKEINGNELQDSDSSVNMKNDKLIDFADAVENISHLNKTPCVDLYRNSGINKFNFNYFYIDGLHPSDAGTTRIAEKIASSLPVRI
ncbi:GDSL-type esterase/lipase family protein [Erwinia rhapontici]|uniref:GDSL-type esterase/lipase family protein n=2 Tax=Erwinia rhapontici TaxID=55212 RepID=UPI003BA2DE6C